MHHRDCPTTTGFCFLIIRPCTQMLRKSNTCVFGRLARHLLNFLHLCTCVNKLPHVFTHCPCSKGRQICYVALRRVSSGMLQHVSKSCRNFRSIKVPVGQVFCCGGKVADIYGHFVISEPGIICAWLLSIGG